MLGLKAPFVGDSPHFFSSRSVWNGFNAAGFSCAVTFLWKFLRMQPHVLTHVPVQCGIFIILKLCEMIANEPSNSYEQRLAVNTCLEKGKTSEFKDMFA